MYNVHIYIQGYNRVDNTMSGTKLLVFTKNVMHRTFWVVK